MEDLWSPVDDVFGIQELRDIILGLCLGEAGAHFVCMEWFLAIEGLLRRNNAPWPIWQAAAAVRVWLACGDAGPCRFMFSRHPLASLWYGVGTTTASDQKDDADAFIVRGSRVVPPHLGQQKETPPSEDLGWSRTAPQGDPSAFADLADDVLAKNRVIVVLYDSLLLCGAKQAEPLASTAGSPLLCLQTAIEPAALLARGFHDCELTEQSGALYCLGELAAARVEFPFDEGPAAEFDASPWLPDNISEAYDDLAEQKWLAGRWGKQPMGPPPSEDDDRGLRLLVPPVGAPPVASARRPPWLVPPDDEPTLAWNRERGSSQPETVADAMASGDVRELYRELMRGGFFDDSDEEEEAEA